MQIFPSVITRFLRQIHIPSMGWTDFVEILIIAFLLYSIILWMKNTRAWSLLRGLVVVGIFIVIAVLFNMTTILWIVQKVASIGILALVVILQPELRSAMMELGQKNIFRTLFNGMSSRFSDSEFSEKTVNEITRACLAMAKVKTGALIIISQETPLLEYERTGIELDAVVTSQLLINIFEKNTPLHDGAVIINGNRVTAATCYLPLSDNKLDKDLGTRHRAGVGISEVSDSLTIIVSEETGSISIARRGALERNVNAAELKERLTALQKAEQSSSFLGNWRGFIFSRKDEDSE